MKLLSALAFVLYLIACQPNALPTVTIIDNHTITTLQTSERVPSALLNQAGITLNPNDRVLLNGLPIAIDQPIISPSTRLPQSGRRSPITLQLRRAVELTIITSDGEKKFQSSAFTVGEALQEASVWLHAGDQVDPPLDSPISSSTISIIPARSVKVTVDGKDLQIQPYAQTVGEALAEAGIPLIGLDYSLPVENEPLPSNGQIKVVRVSEFVLLAQKPVPFENELQTSADIPLDQTQLIQPGEPGLNVQRIRIRYEDGKEITRVSEDETMVRPPKTRILGQGTKIEVKTATVDGVKIEYWRAVQMYATSYSPCRSGVANCGSTTASGKSLRKGLVGIRTSLYSSMRGQQLFIPGYGHASIEDICGGCVGKPWIDLGYSDSDYQQWNSWVTVYFLTPVPANVIYVLE